MGNSVRNMTAIAGKELRSYFSSPVAWVLMALFAALFGYFFYVYLKMFVQESLGGAMEFRAIRAFEAAHIMASRQTIGAEILSDALQILELHSLIAAHARDRRRTRKICVGEIFHHRVPEAAFIVEHIMRKAAAIGDTARIVDILPSAARAGLVDGRAMIIELQRDADDIVALTRQHRGDHGGIDAPRHRRHDARFAGRLGEAQTIQVLGIEGARLCWRERVRHLILPPGSRPGAMAQR